MQSEASPTPIDDDATIGTFEMPFYFIVEMDDGGGGDDGVGNDSDTPDAVPVQCKDEAQKRPLIFPADRLYGRSDERRLLALGLERFFLRRVQTENGNSGLALGDHQFQRGEESQTKSDQCITENKQRSEHEINRRAAWTHDDSNNKNGPEIILLSGFSGSGKSALAESLCEPALSSGAAAFFLRGKFDKLRQCQPYSAFGDAFEGLCRAIISRGDNAIAAVRDALADAVGETWDILSFIAPSLRIIMAANSDESEDNASSSTDLNMSRERFRNVCRSFLLAATTAMTAPSSAIIFLDDLQWADWPSLDMLVSLVSDAALSSSVLVVGTYRSNEVGGDHPLTSRIRGMERRNVRLMQIEVAALTPSAMNELVSDTLRMPKAVTLGLSDAVHRITYGNALFAKQFMCSLVDEGLLRCSGASTGGSQVKLEEVVDSNVPQDESNRKETLPDQPKEKECSDIWAWNVEEIEMHANPDGVVSLLTRRMRVLPLGVINILKLASCLGTRFEASMLRLLVTDAGAQALFWTHLGLAIQKGLLEVEVQCDDHGKAGGSSSKIVRFSHDRIAQAAYELIPTDETPEWHFSIGNRLWGDASPEDLKDAILFIVADQVNRGTVLHLDQHVLSNESNHNAGFPYRSSTDLAQLNRRAALIAMKSSAFVSASSYARAGIDALEQDQQHWKLEYGLSLRLFNIYAEAAYCNGNFFQMEQTLDVVFTRGVTLHDKMHGYRTLIKSLVTRSMFDNAIGTGFDVLAMLGEHLPQTVSKGLILKEMLKTRLVLRNMTDEQILALPTMTNQDKCYSMELLGVLSHCAYKARKEFTPVIAFRMCQITAKHGLSSRSAAAFVLYGMVLCGTGRSTVGCRFGKLALSIADRVGIERHMVAPRVIFYGFIHHWSQPIKSAIEPLLNTYSMGMRVGLVDYAMAALSAHVSFCFHSGSVNLVELEEKLRASKYELLRKGLEDWCLAVILPVWQAVLNLLGRSEDPIVLAGEAMNEEDVAFRESQNLVLKSEVIFYRQLLATTFGHHEIALDVSEENRGIGLHLFSRYAVTRHAFYQGVSSIALARTTGEKKWKRILKTNIKWLEQLDKEKSGNRAHFVHLLEAGLLSLKGGTEKAGTKFDEAIQYAHCAGFVQDEALSNELAGQFYMEQMMQDEGSDYLRQACACYLEWGATAKADQLRQRYKL